MHGHIRAGPIASAYPRIMSLPAALQLTGAIVLVAVVIGIVLRARDGRRRSGGTARMRVEDLPDGPVTSVALLQFSTELCSRCPQVRRLLREVAEDRGIRFAEIDLTHRSDLAARYRVLQTPTTFLLDDSGAIVSRWGGVPGRQSIVDAIGEVLEGRLPARLDQEDS